MRRYNLVTPGTNDVIMGPLREGNPYLTTYPAVKGKPIAELAVGESTLAEYRLSGSRGTYAIVRIDDDLASATDEES